VFYELLEGAKRFSDKFQESLPYREKKGPAMIPEKIK
jgi:hypothetical protein